MSETLLIPSTLLSDADRAIENSFATCFVWVWCMVSYLLLEHTLQTFENSVLRKILRYKKDEVISLGYYITRSFVISTCNFILLVQWKQEDYGGLVVWLG
jgi:hypothetical protein